MKSNSHQVYPSGILRLSQAQDYSLRSVLGNWLLTAAWNLGLIILIRMDSFLHTPMYFFLSKLLAFRFLLLPPQPQNPCPLWDTSCNSSPAWAWPCCLLAAVPYGRYAAISNPLLYAASQSPSLCVQVVIGAYIIRIFGSLIQLCALL